VICFFYNQLADLATEAFFRFGDDQTLQDMHSITATYPQSLQSSYIVRSPTQAGSSQGSFLGTPIAQG